MTEQPPGPPPSGFPASPRSAATRLPPPGGAYPPPSRAEPGTHRRPCRAATRRHPGSGRVCPAATGQRDRQLPQSAYTPWFTRVLASLIDFIPVALIEAIGFGIMMASSKTTCVSNSSEYDFGGVCTAEASALGTAAASIAGLLAFAFGIWNYGYRQGTTGSSIGKSIMNFKVVSERTGVPIGFGMSIVRQIAHLVDAIICYIGYLFPLWDPKRQTLADKIMSTVCLPTGT